MQEAHYYGFNAIENGSGLYDTIFLGAYRLNVHIVHYGAISYVSKEFN